MSPLAGGFPLHLLGAERKSMGGDYGGDAIHLSGGAGGEARRSWELANLPVVEPPAGHVRVRVEACGVCHSDSATVEGVLPIQWPRVPGHEAVGRIDVVGEGVEGWTVGQRVGIGFLGGACGYCEYCRDGDLVNCVNQGYTGVQHDGGYAEMMIAKASGLIAVPDDLSAVAAAPLLCAGLTTFSALRNAPARAGDLVAVFGVGGLGHLSVQYARHMGFEVVAIDRGDDRAELSKKLGAHHYIDSSAADVAKALQERGGAQVVPGDCCVRAAKPSPPPSRRSAAWRRGDLPRRLGRANRTVGV